MTTLQVSTAGTGVVRDAHYVTPTGASAPVRTLLLEPQRTNLCIRSEEFNDAAWLKTATGSAAAPVVAANAAIAPDGTATADRVTYFAPGVGDASTLQQTFVSVVSSVYSTGLFAKAWSAGDVGKVIIFRGAAGATYTAVTLTSEWQRVFSSETAAATSTPFQISLRPGQAGSSSGTVDVLLWGAQAELGAVPSSYIPTVATTVTRNADSLYWSIPALVPRELTVYVRGVNLGTHALVTNGNMIAHVGTNNVATDPRFFIVASSVIAGRVIATYDDAITVASASVDASTTPVLFDLMEYRAVITSSWNVTFGVSVNTAAEVVSTSAAASGPAAAFAAARLYIAGTLANVSDPPKAITNIAIALGTKTRADMRAIAGVP
jgi:hypothetical protein